MSLQRRSEMPTMPLPLLSRDAWRKILEVDHAGVQVLQVPARE